MRGRSLPQAVDLSEPDVDRDTARQAAISAAPYGRWVHKRPEPRAFGVARLAALHRVPRKKLR
jgi:hypothetical protein